MITKAYSLKVVITSLWKQQSVSKESRNLFLEYFNNNREDAYSGAKVLQTVQSTAYIYPAKLVLICVEHGHGSQVTVKHPWYILLNEKKQIKMKAPIRKEVEMVIKSRRHPLSLCQTSVNTWFFQEDCIKLFREVNPAKLVTALCRNEHCFQSTVSNLSFTSSYLLFLLQGVASLAEELWYTPHFFPHASVPREEQ